MELMWLPFSLATIFFYGVGQVFAKETRAAVPSANLLLLFGANVFVIWIVYWFAFGDTGPYPTSAWLQAVIAAALSGISYITYYESMKHGKISILGTIAGAYAPWTVLLALTFLGETMTVAEGAGVALVIGSMLIFMHTAGTNGNRRTELLGIAFAVCSLFFWGTSAAVAKGAIEEIGDSNFIGVFAVVCPSIWLVYWLVSQKGKIELPKTDKRILELSLLFIALGGVTMYLAIANGPVSIVMPITNLYPIMTIAVAKIRLKEKLNAQQVVALALLVLAILVFSV
jgi:drug/metabolite transporter (DMT)-like permease